MTEEWKNARAEAEMREFDKENMTKAAQKRKEQELHGKWTIDLTTSGENARELMEKFIDELVLLTKQNSLNFSIQIDPVIEPNKTTDNN
jgi:hypothetical protein